MAIIANDTFTEADGVAYVELQNHTSDSGHTWTVQNNNPLFQIDTSLDRLLAAGQIDPGEVATLNITPPSPDYAVTANVNTRNDLNFTFFGVGARCQIDGSGYYVLVDPNEQQFQLVRKDVGASVTLDFASPAGTTWQTVIHALTVEAVGSTIKGYVDGVEVLSANDTTYSTALKPGLTLRGVNSGPSTSHYQILDFSVDSLAPPIPAIRKSSTFDVETTLGTITTATLNGVNVFDHVTGQVGTTVSFAGAATDEITNSGEYSLVLGDGTGTETITLQVNVYGVTPSNNPLQKDGAALASLTGVQVRVTNSGNINGTELFYSGTATTDASGNLGNIDLSSTAAADADPVLLHMRTSSGDSIIASETVGLI